MIDYQRELKELEKRIELLESKVLNPRELQETKQQVAEFERWKSKQLLQMVLAVLFVLAVCVMLYVGVMLYVNRF